MAGVEIGELDLADLGSVERFADEFLASGRGVDMLINNAAVMANELTRVGPDGWESQFAIDHLGHFALANRLWPALARGGGARVVSVSSRGHKFSGIRWDDMHWARGYDKWQAYGQAKTANVLFAVALDARGKHAGVRGFAVYPAGVRTPLQRHLTHQEMRDLGWYDDQGKLAPLFKTPEQGAAGEAWAATSPSWTAWAASTSSAATSRRSPTLAPTRASRKASTRTRSTPGRPSGCGRSRPGSPASMPSPRPERARSRRSSQR